MAPEQIRGQPRQGSDQYALGIVIYELLSSDTPFHGLLPELCSQHLYADPPPLREKVPEVSPAVEQVIMQALAKDPVDRFASVQQFAAALEIATQSTEAAPQEKQFLVNRGRATNSRHSSSALPPWSYQPSQQIATDVHTLHARGQRMLTQGQRSSAIRLFLQVLALEPEYDRGNLVFLLRELLQDEIKEALRSEKQDEALRAWQILKKLWPPSSNMAKLSAIYEQALQSIGRGDFSTAKELLRNLWNEAPKYSDLLCLAPKVGLQSYRMARGSGFWNTGTTWIHLFCLLAGLSATTAILTQSWIWTLGLSGGATLFFYIAGYHRAVRWLPILIIAILSGVVAQVAGAYAASFNYTIPLTKSLPRLFGGTYSEYIYIGRQIDMGVIFGISCGLLISCGALHLHTSNEGWAYLGVIGALIGLIDLLAFVMGSSWGFGLNLDFGLDGLGLPLSLFGLLLGIISAVELIRWLRFLGFLLVSS